jgi:hypothetical protein
VSITEEQLRRLIAERLNTNNDVRVLSVMSDRIEGSFSEIVHAICEVVDQHGPVVWGV